MSAKRGKSERLDRYYTPAWMVEQTLHAARESGALLPGCRVIDAGAGRGAFTTALLAAGHAVHAVDLDRGALESIPRHPHLRRTVAPFLDVDDRAPLVVSNPPFSHAQAFVEHALRIAPAAVFLLRLGFVSTETRCEWLASAMPRDVWLFRHRGAFQVPEDSQCASTGCTKLGGHAGGHGKQGTDSAEYAVLVWRRHNPAATRLRWLPAVPSEVRREFEALSRKDSAS